MAGPPTDVDPGLGVLCADSEPTQPPVFRYFSMLPLHLRMLVFSFLDVTSLVNGGQVCRDWYDMLIACDYHWKNKVIGIRRRPSDVLPDPRVCHVSIVADGKMWVHGGHLSQMETHLISLVHADLHYFDFSSKSWHQVTPKQGSMPFKTEHSACLFGNEIVLFGGYGHGRDSCLYTYNYVSNTCTQLEPADSSAPVPPIRSAHSACVWNSQMFVYGGWDGEASRDDFWSYSFADRTWACIEPRGQRPPPLRSHSAVVCEDNMFLFGGFPGIGDTHPRSMWRFNFLINTWFEESTVYNRQRGIGIGPCGRSRSKCSVEGGRMYMLGGWDRKRHFGDLYSFDTESFRWDHICNFDQDGIGQHSLVSHDNYLWSFGGFKPKNGSANDFFAIKMCRPDKLWPSHLLDCAPSLEG